MTETRNVNAERALGAIISDIRDEFKEFLNTRMEMLKSEFRETAAAARIAVPLALLALGLLGTGLLLFTGAVIVLIAAAFAGNPYAWFFAFAIVGFIWMVLGAAAAFFADNAFRSKSMFPKRTVEVLQADKVWLQSEARSAL
jgi:uncharacterized membrane protein YqjE